MDYTHINRPPRIEVLMRGQFTFFDTHLFSNIREMLTIPEMKVMVLNFREVDFIDSAALGMLLLARVEAELHGVRLVLVQPSRVVEKAFKISEFDTLFEMQE